MELEQNKGARLREGKTLKKYIDFLFVPSGRILDVGCGDGTVLKKLKTMGCDGVGLDLKPLHWNSTDLSFVIGDGYRLPFQDNTFDAAGCFTVLEHLEDPEGFLQEMVAAVKEGGKIILSAPNMRGIFIRKRGHFVTQRGGGKQLFVNGLVYFRDWFYHFFSPHRIRFDIKPLPDMSKIPRNASDYNAICATNFVTLRHFLKKRGIKIVYESCALVYPEERWAQWLVSMIDRLPIVRHFFGGIFIVGEKQNYRL